MSTLFAILSLLIRVYTISHSQQSDQGLHCLHSQPSDQGLHYLPFSAVWSGSTLFAILSSLIGVYTVCHCQSDQGLHFLEFSVLSGSTLFAILSLLRVYTACHSQQSDQSLHYLPFSAVWSRSRSTLLFSGAVWSGSTFCHSQLSDQCLHYLQSSAFWSACTLFPIHNLIRVYTICHSQYDQGLQLLPFSAVWTRSTLSF